MSCAPVRSTISGPGFEYWLLKFDGVANNKDKDTLADPQGYGAIEYAYSLMARDAGDRDERMPAAGGERSPALHDPPLRSRRTDGAKRHMQSLGALAHFDFNQPGAHSYEQAFLIMRRLGLPTAAVEQHVPPHGLQRRSAQPGRPCQEHRVPDGPLGHWELAPAFDVTYAYRPSSAWTDKHQMTINGKRERFTLADFSACARTASLPRGRATRIVQEICEVLSAWEDYARRAGVDDEHVQRIGPALRLSFPRE